MVSYEDVKKKFDIRYQSYIDTEEPIGSAHYWQLFESQFDNLVVDCFCEERNTHYSTKTSYYITLAAYKFFFEEEGLTEPSEIRDMLQAYKDNKALLRAHLPKDF